MIKFAAVATVTPEGESLLVIQRVHLYERAHNMVPPIGSRQFESLAAPFVMKRFPEGRIIGWFDTHQELSNHNEIEITTEDVEASDAKR